MKYTALFHCLMIFLTFIGCSNEKETVLLEKYNLNNAKSYAYRTRAKLSDFLENYRIIDLEENEFFVVSGIVTIMKKENIFYVISSYCCNLFNENGKFVKTIEFRNLLKNEDALISGFDICTVNGKEELWVGSGIHEQIIYRVSLDDGKELGTIDINIPFSNFKNISDTKIVITPIQNHFILAVYDQKSKNITYGFKKKQKDAGNGESIMPYNGKYLVSYPFTSLVGYYDNESDTFKEILLMEDDGIVNTHQKQTELIEKVGINRGTNIAYDNYGIINYLVGINETKMISFKIKEKEYLSIQRGNNPYKTIEVTPNIYSMFKIDICSFEDSYRQLINHFYARTYSDDSILLFFLSDRNNFFDAKKRKVSIIEVY